jgi:hypothetical protein
MCCKIKKSNAILLMIILSTSGMHAVSLPIARSLLLGGTFAMGVGRMILEKRNDFFQELKEEEKRLDEDCATRIMLPRYPSAKDKEEVYTHIKADIGKHLKIAPDKIDIALLPTRWMTMWIRGSRAFLSNSGIQLVIDSSGYREAQDYYVRGIDNGFDVDLLHDIGHIHCNHDIKKPLAAFSFMACISFAISKLPFFKKIIHQKPPLVGLGLTVAAVGTYKIANILTRGVSRYQEIQADDFAIQKTRNVEGLEALSRAYKDSAEKNANTRSIGFIHIGYKERIEELFAMHPSDAARAKKFKQAAENLKN